MKVESVVAHAPGDVALFGSGRRLVGLALDAEIHNVIAADRAIVDDDVPRPKRNRVPLFNLESLF